MLTKNIHYEDNGVMRIAKWDHLLDLYKLDCSDKVHMLPLTDVHVIPSKINKMKVHLNIFENFRPKISISL